jgi:CheY-like chemotaxis protein
MLAWLVRAMGGEPREAHDGPSAVAAAREFAPDVVLLDIGLPGMDGYDVCRQVRRDAGGRRVHIAAITGWGQEKDKALAAGAGFDSHLTKPADPAVIERLLNAARTAIAS